MQITFRDAVKLLRDAERIDITHDGNRVVSYSLSPAEDAILDAFGDYVISEICANGEYSYEVGLATKFVKAGEQ